MTATPHTPTPNRYQGRGERFGATHRHWQKRCSTCAHFQRGPAGDAVQQCTNPDALLYRASEDMDLATACRLYEVRG